MRRARIATATILSVAALGATVGFSGCSSDNFKDVKGVVNHEPPQIENWENADGHPNIVILCIHGEAMMTTTRDFKAVEHAPWWNKKCRPDDTLISNLRDGAVHHEGEG